MTLIDARANPMPARLNRPSRVEVGIVIGILFASFATYLIFAIPTIAYLVGHYFFRSHRSRKPPFASVERGYRDAVNSSIAQQVLFVVFTALILDGGQCLHGAVVAALGYWVAFLLVGIFRQRAPTAMDLLLVRYGYLIILFTVELVGPIVWAARGRG